MTGGDAKVKIDLPNLTRDRGRIYVRARRWPRKIRLLAELGTTGFLEEYRAAVATLEREAKAPSASPAGSFHWLCEKYYASAEYKGLAERTRHVRRQILDREFVTTGDRPYRFLQGKHIRRMRDAARDRGPEAANNLLKALRALFKWAVDAGLAEQNPVRDVPLVRSRSGGWHTWTVSEVEQFMERHPPGSKAHLAMSLMLYTGARRSDVVHLGRQMVRDGWLTWQVQKTGREHSVPVLPVLQAVINATPSGHLNFLVTDFGKPFTAAGFGNWFRKRCDEAGLGPCSAHGLRKASATMAANNGATGSQLMAIYGWETLKMAELYTREADRRRLAAAATHLLQRECVSPSAGDVSQPEQVHERK